MKKFKKFMTVFLAIVMCVSSVLSVSAENTGGSDESRTTSLRAPVEGTILFSTDFAESNPFRVVGSGSKGTIGLVTDNDTARGQVLEIKKTASGIDRRRNQPGEICQYTLAVEEVGGG